MEQFIKIGAGGDGAPEVMFLQARLLAQIAEAEEGGYVVHCPALDVVSQGDTIREARANIKEAVELLLETCFERGTLMKRLAKSGFRTAAPPARPKRRGLRGANVREIRVPAKIPLMATA